MAARVADLCDAIASYIESQTYSYSFNVHRDQPASADLRDTRTTNVYVYPLWEGGKQLPVDTRGHFGKQYSVIVHITNFIDDQDSGNETNHALALAEEIEQSLENVGMAGFAMLTFANDAGGTNFLEVEALHERNYFHVPITINYITVE